jgi:hypothetical protein
VFVGWIIHFEILNFCIISVLEKNLLPNVFTVEISTKKTSKESGKCRSSPGYSGRELKKHRRKASQNRAPQYKTF